MIILWNKQKGSGGSGGSGSSFPITVTDSGSSLPVDLSGYNEGDTFLNTSDKKIYTAKSNSYELSSNAVNYENRATIDFITGIATNLGKKYQSSIGDISAYIYYNNIDVRWKGDLQLDFHFKITGNLESNKYYFLAYSYHTGYYYGVALKTDGVYFYKFKTYQSSFVWEGIEKILDISWEQNIEYYLRLDKNGSTTKVSLSNVGYDSQNIKENNIEISDHYGQYSSATGKGFVLGSVDSRVDSSATIFYGNLPISVYLLDTTTKNYLIPSAISWDSETELTDKTEYADKTNGILYLYENDELVAINTPSSFSSITGNATDNTSLATALSSKKDKAETITISTASVTIANVQANKNYVLSSSALTNITLTACETSFEETSINFTTGSSAPTFTDNASIKWFGGVPEMKANTTYTIVIFNKQAYWQEQENV